MSLQVWLPLNGDLHNQGLSNINLTNTVTFATSGKIGASCLNSQLGWFAVPEMAGKKQMSFAYWVKLNAGTTTNWLDPFSWYSTNGTSDHRSRQEFYYYNSGGNTEAMTTGVWYYNQSNSGLTQRKIGQWYHYAFTINYATGITQFFVDGVLWKTTTNADTSHYVKGSNFLLRESSLDCSINDFRLYDHILSAKEVEEIAKGLVLHYKLDNNGFGNPNLLINSLDASSGSGASGITKSIGLNGEQVIVAESGNGNWVTFNNHNTTLDLAKGDTFTFSLKIKSPNSTKKPTVYFQSGMGYFSMQGTMSNEYSIIYYTGTWNIDNLTTNIHLGFSSAPGTYYIEYFKLEEGNQYTPWAPSVNDVKYGNMLSNIIYDSSGYDNNGIITGNLTTDSNSIRYGVTTVFPSGGYIRVEKRPAACLPKEALTVNLWQYSTSWSNPISCTEGGGWNFENSSGIRFPVYISGVGYKVAQSSITPASLNNAWHMLTGTMDKDNIKIYIDGEEAGTVTTGSTNGIGYANNYLFISGEASGNSVTPANSNYTGKLSDVRIYATALTPEQIKELYNTSMSIDDKGNIHARELVEL